MAALYGYNSSTTWLIYKETDGRSTVRQYAAFALYAKSQVIDARLLWIQRSPYTDESHYPGYVHSSLNMHVHWARLTARACKSGTPPAHTTDAE